MHITPYTFIICPFYTHITHTHKYILQHIHNCTLLHTHEHIKKIIYVHVCKHTTYTHILIHKTLTHIQNMNTRALNVHT